MSYHKTYVSFIILKHLSTSTEIVVTIRPVLSEVFVTKCHHFFHHVQKGVVFALLISGVTGLIFIKFAQYLEKICC